MSYHLTYLEAVVTGLVQGVTELFPVSSLGHNVLLPALVGGSWASTLNVSAPGSPYLAFIVGLHVATAIAMIAYFWRDWLRIVRGFLSSLRRRSVTTPDQRLAWMIILGTIPVGIVGLALQKEFTKRLRQAGARGGLPRRQRGHPAGQRADAAGAGRRAGRRRRSRPAVPPAAPAGPVPGGRRRASRAAASRRAGWAGASGRVLAAAVATAAAGARPRARARRRAAAAAGRGTVSRGSGQGQYGRQQPRHGGQQPSYGQPERYGRAPGRHAAGRAPDAPPTAAASAVPIRRWPRTGGCPP